MTPQANCYSHLTAERIREAIARIENSPKRLKVGPHAGKPLAWRELPLLRAALAEKA